MKRAVSALVVAASLALATSASAAYPNGGVYTFSLGSAGGSPLVRTISSQLTRPGGYIFTTHYFNYAADKLLGQKRDLGDGTLFAQPTASRYMGPDQGFVMWAANNTPFPADAGFNVLYAKQGSPNVFTVTAVSGNTHSNYVYIDHPSTNNRPDAKPIVQQLYVYGQLAGNGPRNIGVFYEPSRQKWAIFHQNRSAPMQMGEQYDVLVPSSNVRVLVAEGAGVRGNGFAFRLAGRRLIVTQNWSPRMVYNDHPIGIRALAKTIYPGSGPTPEMAWEIFNEDGAAMPAGAAFDVVYDDEATVQ